MFFSDRLEIEGSIRGSSKRRIRVDGVNERNWQIVAQTLRRALHVSLAKG